MFGKKDTSSSVQGQHAGNQNMDVMSDPMAAYNAAAYAGRKNRHNGGKRALIAFGIVVLVLAAVYGVGAFFFSSHFFPNTVLNDQDFSYQPSNSLAADIQSQANNYSLDIKGEGFSYTFKKGDAPLDVNADQIAADAAARQDIMKWPLEMFKTHDVSDLVVAKYDTDAVSEPLKKAVDAFNKDKQPSKNASIVYDQDDNAFTVQSEVYGSQIDADRVIAQADDALEHMITNVELTKEDLLKPAIISTDERMEKALQTVDSMFKKNITLTLNKDVDVATIDKATFASWIKLSKDYEPSLNKKAISSWIKKENLSSMNTVGTKRTWTRADGKKCSASGGTYGWKVDTSSLADSIVKAIEKGETTVAIPCSQSADVYAGAGKRDWGAYVDVDLSQQKVRYYDANDKLVHEANCVTGNVSAGHDTPTGIYFLNSKQSPCLLVGRTPSGEISYKTKVQYWMPFIRSSIGLHDASWRGGTFGGSIYKTNGSHGCVNLPTADAKWFYNNLKTGVCVIVHK